MSDSPDLPHGLALAWGVAERPHRGPRRELSIERIVETAIELADAEGLGALSMAKVAQRLGFTTMSLYRYVTSKDDLLLLMQELVLDVDFPAPHDPADWRAELREWVMLVKAMLDAHPWYLDVPVAGAPMTPGNLRVVDAGLRALRSTPLDEEEKMSVILLGSGYAKNAAQLQRDLGRAVAAGGGDDDVLGGAYLEVLRELVDEVRFPYLRPLVESGSYVGEGQLDDVAFGLERLLDGVAVYVEARDAGAPGAGRDFRAAPADGSDAVAESDAAQNPDHVVVTAAADLARAYAKDPKVKRAVTRRREADKQVREAQKRVRELQRSLDEAVRNEAEALRSARARE